MSKGIVRQSSSPFVASVRVAKKPDGGLRFCIDWGDIYSKTLQNGYPLGLVKKTLNLFGNARVYTKLDVRGADYLLRVKEGDEHKLAFWTWYGLFEPTVMQFGTTNAPADFQSYIDNAIRETLDDFSFAYLDNVLIYRDSEEEHVSNVKWIMLLLLDAGLYLKLEKCGFH